MCVCLISISRCMRHEGSWQLFGANGGFRPSMDGLAFPTKIKTFWVIKYLNIYSTNK